jgi:hypothetical protein
MTLPKSARKTKDVLWTKPDLGVRVPRTGTTSAIQFFKSFRQILAFLRFILRMAGQIEHVAEQAHNTLLKVENDESKRQLMLKEWQQRKGPVDELKKHRQFFMEVILVRQVENYLNYLSSLLKETFVARPEVLRSAEKIDLEVVLRHDSIEDLVRTVAERKVESLTYSSFLDLAAYFNDKFHIILFPDTDVPSVVTAIETRNISVHNRCIVNQRYISRTGEDPSQMGQIKALWVQDIEKISRIFAQSVCSVDADAHKRLKVAGHRYPKTPME